MFKKPKNLSIILILSLFTIISCSEENYNEPTLSSENQNAPQHIWNKFSEQQKIDINSTINENKDCTYYIEEFEIEFWKYPVFDENGTLTEIAHPIIGTKNTGENNYSNIIIDQKINSNQANLENINIETGNANINYWSQAGALFENNQLIINTTCFQKSDFDLETNELKFYISNGTGIYNNTNGFSYVKIEVEKEAVYGCYPNNADFPDDYEDGTCVENFSCYETCKSGQGKGKLYLIGFTCNK